MSLMLAVISENSWQLNEIDRNETVTALNGIAPDCIIAGLFDLYATKVSDHPEKYQYNENMVCHIIAQYILQQGSKFHVGDFMNSWQDALPEGMTANVRRKILFCRVNTVRRNFQLNFFFGLQEKYLRGIGIVDKDATPPCVRALTEINLSTKLMDRLKVLFKAKVRWTLEEIEPYIE